MLKKILVLIVIALALIAAWYVFRPVSESKAVEAAPTLTLAEPLPDLVVSKLQVKPHPKKSKQVLVTFEIKNQGGDVYDRKPDVKVEVLNKEGEVVDSQVIKNFTPGTKAGSCTFTVDNTKQYQVKAIADYHNFVRESDENNNNRQLIFSIGRKI